MGRKHLVMFNQIKKIAGCMFLCFAAISCNQLNQLKNEVDKDTAVSCEGNLPSRLSANHTDSAITATTSTSHEGMIWIEGGTFVMGASDDEGRSDEYPQHEVKLDGYWIDATEVTNSQFKIFVDATGYITTAEKAPDWEEMKKQLPAGTPKPPDNLLVAASLVFTPTQNAVPLNNASQWWNPVLDRKSVV